VASGIDVIGYSLLPESVGPGDKLGVEIVWNATQALGKDLNVQLSLQDSAGKVWGEWIGRPVGDTYPTSSWRAGEVLRGRYALDVDIAAPVGELQLVAALIDSKGAAPSVGGSAVLGSLKVVPNSRLSSATPPTSVEREFGNEIKLLGFDLRGSMSGVAYPGGTLKVVPYWQALSRPAKDYTVFVQVLNAAGQVVAQHDAPPQLGEKPTTSWAKGEIVLDEHSVTLSENLAEGSYRIIVGLYEGSSGRRLPLATGEDFVALTTLKVSR
jgi:hypothetical protein